MKRLIIAIDCDDVLLPSSEFVVDLHNKLYGTNISLANAHSSVEWEEKTGLDRQGVIQRFIDIQNSEDYSIMKPFEDAIRTCRKLAHSHDLHIVTARHDEAKSTTESMVERYFGASVFKEMYHVGDSTTKGDVCATLCADVIIDDGIKHLMTARDCGVNWRIWFGDYLWQRDIDGKDAYTSRARDWTDVEAEIERIANS